ncbi:MAG: DUF4184 family protein [Rhodoferax sp.]|nr:DUF4184 family protein [Rhodoferax sp.]
MDVEPGIGMLLGWDVLHGPSHTIVGALLIASLVVWISPRICTPLLMRFNHEARHYGQEWLCEPDVISRTALVTGAFFGTLSHLVLDSFMHRDIRPLYPFTQLNPLRDLVSHDGVYQLCMAAGAIGTLAWVTLKWASRPRQ